MIAAPAAPISAALHASAAHHATQSAAAESMRTEDKRVDARQERLSAIFGNFWWFHGSKLEQHGYGLYQLHVTIWGCAVMVVLMTD